MIPNPNEIAKIYGYKHDGSLHRVWNRVKILYADEIMIICGNHKTKVIEENGKYWTTKEPALCFFFKKYWFNVIAMMKNDGIYYYCNLSTPYEYDKEAIKYIDYDLDVKIYPDGRINVLDKEEFEMHQKRMNYDEPTIQIIEKTLDELLNFIREKKGPFNHEFVDKWYKEYRKMGF